MIWLVLLLVFPIVIFILLLIRYDFARVLIMNPPEENWFDHERLEVYRESIAFVAWVSAMLEGTVRIGDVKDQLDRSSTSIPLNIAEGNGKYTPKDRCRFFDIAHGSALECAAGLDTLVAKGKLTVDQIRPGKERLQRIVKMLMGLIKRNSTREYERISMADDQVTNAE